MVNANQVTTFLTKPSAGFGRWVSKPWQQLFQVDPEICDERFSDLLTVIPFGRMSSNLSASAMLSKANENDRRYKMFKWSKDFKQQFSSPKFMAARAEMTTELSSLAMCIKDRTVRHKQASTYVVESFSKTKVFDSIVCPLAISI